MRLLLAPDSFKGTFSAVEAADALARGVERTGAQADRCPVADGGEGTMEVLLAALGGERVIERVRGPLGRDVEAAYARLGPDGERAVVEMAQASGLALVAEVERDPWAASTYGTGQLLAAAAAAGAREILVAVGGSATTDGGRGALDAVRERGGVGSARIVVLCDVQTPWERCAEVYAPQKGANPKMVRRLGERLDALAAELPRDPRGVPMTGAAGGLSGGLWAGLGAEVVPGAPHVLEVTGFDRRLPGAVAVVVGEGRLDAQSLMGKIVGEIAARARAAGVPAHAVVGQAALTEDEARELGLASVTEAPTLEALERAGEALARGGAAGAAPGEAPAGAGAAQAALDEALALEAEGQRLLLAGDAAGGAERLEAASERYRASWEHAGPRSFGRLVGMLKAAVIAGDARSAAVYAREQLGPDGVSPPSWYALAIAAAALGDDAEAARAAAQMRGGGDAFARTADALGALARRDAAAYTAALRAIVADFEARPAHLTGVPFADTALVLERLAAPRGLAAYPASSLLPPA
jgi:glycerate 2-kinase